MKRQELIAPVETLTHAFSKFEFAYSLLVMFGVALFSFFFASVSVAGAQTDSFVTAGIWHQGGEWLRAYLGDEHLCEYSRCIGCACAGFTAAVFFVVVRHFLFYLIGNLCLIEYYRVHMRLFFWTTCVVLSFTLSQFFIELFIPVTQGTVNVVLVSLVIWLSILSLRMKWTTFLCAAFALLGVLSAVSISGVIMLIVVTMILFFARESISQSISGYGYGHENAYGVGFGSYGVSQDIYGSYGTTQYAEVEMADQMANALMAERTRLLLLLSFIMGLVFTLTLVFGYGMFSGASARNIILQWLSCFGAELKGILAAVDLMALACCVTISFLFVNYRLARMFDSEYYLKAKDLFRLGTGFLLACVVLICAGKRMPFVVSTCLREMPLLPLAIQVVASEVMLVVAAIFLVNLKCRKINSVARNADETEAVRQYKWMRTLLLLFFDLLPAFLLATGIVRVWRDFL